MNQPYFTPALAVASRSSALSPWAAAWRTLPAEWCSAFARAGTIASLWLRNLTSDLAAVLTYMRTAWGNKADAVNADDVKKIRAEIKSPQPMNGEQMMKLPE